MAIGAGATEANIDTTTRALDLSKDLLPGPLQSQLQSCASGPFYSTDFSIAHRGAPLGYPEHSREGYIAAATQGAGVIECDVTFTKDLELVCRHSQCDLATSTNILQTELSGELQSALHGRELTDSPCQRPMLHQRHHPQRIQNTVRPT